MNQFNKTAIQIFSFEQPMLLVTGWFSENEQKDNEIKAYIDGEELEVISSFRLDRHMQPYEKAKKRVIYVRYFLAATLPDNYEESAGFTMINKEKNKSQTIVSLNASELKEIGSSVEQYIEEAVCENGQVIIRGWYIEEEGMEVRILDSDKNRMNIEVQYQYRPDVIKQYPACMEKQAKGFLASCEKSDVKMVYVCFEGSKAKKTVPCDLNPSKLHQILRKTIAYYHRNGLTGCVKRVGEKLLHVEETNYEKWLKEHLPDMKELDKQRKTKFPSYPKISIVVPLYKTPENYLAALIKSIQSQTYTNWELCLSDGSGSGSPISTVLEKYRKMDERIKVVSSEEPLQISENTNKAIGIATGDFVAFADHDDMLVSHALYECISAFMDCPNYDAVYSDEDKVTMNGKGYFQPHFKPDFNLDLLRTTNYICHLFVVRREIVEKVGGLRAEFDGAQDYDFVLRCLEQCRSIGHIPQILYHWRAHKDSTAENPASKMYAFEAGARAVEDYYERNGISAKVEQGECLGLYRTKYNIEGAPLVSIIIPNKDHIEDLECCIQSIENQSSYLNIEYIIVENNSNEDTTFQYYETLSKKNNKVRVLYWEGEFNYSMINNYGVSHANGEYLLFLNNDAELMDGACIQEMLGFCMRDEVGAVGARLCYEDGSIQHAGVVIGLGGVAGHIFCGTPKDSVGYFGRIVSAQEYSAVTAACMMTKKTVFEAVNGFDEKFKVAFNDIDYCLKVRKAGKLVVYNPYARLYHYESKSRGRDDIGEKAKRFNEETKLFEEKWLDYLVAGDPYYNSNLSLDKPDCSIKQG